MFKIKLIKITLSFLKQIILFSLILSFTSGCNMVTRISEVGKDPKVSPIQNPQARPDYKPVSLPMPAPKVALANPNSLWRSGARAFFKDHRAKEIGDLVTVKLTLDDELCSSLALYGLLALGCLDRLDILYFILLINIFIITVYDKY